MKLFGKLFTSALFAATLVISAPASAGDTGGMPVNILCHTLQSAVTSILNVGQDSLIPQAARLVDQMIDMGCSADMIPALPK